MKLFKYTSNIFTASIAVLTLSGTNVFADGAEDFFTRHTLARYFQTQVTARSMGMGGAYAALKDGTLGVVGNPATLSSVVNKEISLTYQFEQVSGDLPGTFTSVDEDIHRGLILGTMPVMDQLTVGLGFEPSFSELDDTNDLETNTFQVPLGIAYQVNDMVSVGYGLTYFDDEVESNLFTTDSQEAFSHRFGFIYDHSSELSFGFVGNVGHGELDSSNVNTAVSSGDFSNWGIRGGVSWLANPQLLVVGDIAYSENDSDGSTNFLGTFIPFDEGLEVFSVQGGAEYMLNELIDLRTGVGYTTIDYNTIDAAVSALIDDSDWVHWSGGASYEICENASADAAVQIRFLDEVDVLAGVTLNVHF